MTEKTAAACPRAGAGEPAAGGGAIADFERLYRANVEAVMAYFARRSGDPHDGVGDRSRNRQRVRARHVR